MSQTPRYYARLLSALVSGAALAIVLPVMAEETQAPEPLAAPVVAPGRVLTLAECVRLALDRQPILAAQRASLSAALTQQQTLDGLGAVARLGNPDLPIRRQQACLGVGIAEAGLRQAELEWQYNVTRLYFTVLYARAQRQAAEDVASQFEFYYKTVSEGIKKAGAPKEWTSSTVDKLNVYNRLALAKKEEASAGIDRATAALREAMGCSSMTFQVGEEELPEPPSTKLNKDELVAMAQALRGEVTMSCKLAEVFDLEVAAQGKHCLPGQQPTFASGGDIHARQVPADRINGDYLPGTLPPEMPPFLVGSKAMRQQRAHDLATRAHALAEKTRNLIALEAENYYFRTLESQRKVDILREAAKAGVALSEETRKGFAGGQNVKIDDVLSTEVVSAQARSQLNEAHWQYLLNLAALERVTGGGFIAGLTEPAPK